MFEIEKVRKIFYVDLLFTFILLNGYITSQFTFINNIVAFLISAAFVVGIYCLISSEWLINVILSVVYSGFGSVLLINIIPFRRWTGNNIILLVVIGILLFIALLLLHAFQVLNDIIHKRTTYRKYVKYAYSHSDNYKSSYSKSDYDTLRKSHTQTNEERVQEILERMNKINEEFSQKERAKQESQKRDEQEQQNKKYEQQSRQEPPKQTISDVDESLFSGCNSKESLTRRYKQLMKTFHPDNQDGDTNMTIKIQKTYEALSKKYE